MGSDQFVQLSLDSGTIWQNATLTTGTTWPLDSTANTLPDGSYTIQARVIDAAGSVGQTDSQIIVIDSTAPVGNSIEINSVSPDTGTGGSDFITNTGNLIFAGVIQDPLTAGDRVQVSLDNGITWSDASVSGLIWSYDNTTNLIADGDLVVMARIIDSFGNVVQNAFETITFDSVAPLPTETITISAINADSAVVGDFITSDTTLVFSGTLSAPLGAGEGVSFSIDGGTTYFAATVTGTTWSYDNSANTLTDGIYNLKARVVDAAGNFVNTANQTLTVDTVAPTTSITLGAISTDSAISTDFITNDNTLIFTGTLGSALAVNERGRSASTAVSPGRALPWPAPVGPTTTLPTS